MCSGKVHEDMMADWMRNLEPTIPPMLEGGLRVMIYAGENDFICNWLGNHRWVKAMEWSGSARFNAAMPQPFVVDGTTAGDVTELEGSLSFVKVSESGHMVPMDQPRNAVEMLRRFINGEAIAGGKDQAANMFVEFRSTLSSHDERPAKGTAVASPRRTSDPVAIP